MTALETQMTAPPPDDVVLFEEQLRARLASAALEVPLLPEVAAAVIAGGDEAFDFRKVSEQVHRDQALAGHVLRIANSAALGGTGAHIVSLQQALVRLGTRRVRELVMAVVMKTRIFRSNRHLNLAKSIWREAAGTAFMAREIARFMRRNPESAFLCGLLHNVGKPIVLQVISDVESIEDRPLDEATIERFVMEFYCAAGQRLVGPWHLPAPVSEAINFHLQPTHAPSHKELVIITAVASKLTPLILQGASLETLAQLSVYDELHLYSEDIQAILAHVDGARAYVEAIG